MRRLPAALIAVATVVPALTAVAMSSDAGGAVRPPPMTKPHPVATKVSELVLSGIAAGASGPTGAETGTEISSGARGAPGAMASMATTTPAVLTAALATAGFQTLGVTWKATSATPDLLISVRTHRPAAAGCGSCRFDGVHGWSAWDELDDDAGPDTTAAPGARGGTDPLWVGSSDGVQARIVVRSGRLPKDLRLELVDPGSSDYDATAVGTPLVVSSAGKPAILSRAAWGADERRVRHSPDYMPTIKAAVLHHTAGPNGYSASQVPAIIRGDYAYHLSRGWNDIGYNALVDRFGRIWEGRAGGLDRAVMGAHAGGYNTDTFGVSMIGNLDVAHPSAASIAAVARVIAWKLDANHRDPTGTTRLTSAGGPTARHRLGVTSSFPVIMGHRDTGYTACPGRYLYPDLPAIRSRVRSLIGAALINPTGPPASAPRGAKVSITARALAAQSWQLDVTAPCGGGRVARVTGSARAEAQIVASWNGRVAGGAQARPGRYTLELTSKSASAVARPVVYHVLVLPPAPTPQPPGPPSGGSGGYLPVTPTRLLDTRTGGRIGLGPQGRVAVPVLGRAGVPASGVSSVVLNLTATCVSDDTTLTVWPAGLARSNRPVTAVPAGVTRSVLVTARVGADGAVDIGNGRGVTELTADVVGYYATGGLPIRPISSTRLYDSRLDSARGVLKADQPRLIRLPATLGGVAAPAIQALIVDVTALGPTGNGALTAYRPGAAGDLPTLNYRRSEHMDNLAVVPVSGGEIAIKATGTPVDAILDVRGLVVDAATQGTAFTPLRSVLAFDTGTGKGVLRVGSPRRVVLASSKTGVPSTAGAALISLTAAAPSVQTSLQAYPAGLPSTGGSAVRVSAGDTRGNLVVVTLGSGGAIELANAQGSTQVRVDVLGYFQ
jgi:hypothetical protein